MSEVYEIVLPAGKNESFAKDLLKQIKSDGWAAHLRKVNTDARPE